MKNCLSKNMALNSVCVFFRKVYLIREICISDLENQGKPGNSVQGIFWTPWCQPSLCLRVTRLLISTVL